MEVSLFDIQIFPPLRHGLIFTFQRIKVVILSLSVISYTQAQQQQIEEQIEHSTQHTVEIQPHYYQFQSIGTNNLPPGIEGVFVGRPLRSPTPFPQRLTQSEYLFCQITLKIT